MKARVNSVLDLRSFRILKYKFFLIYKQEKQSFNPEILGGFKVVLQ
jgi:hypothetical protein